MGTRTDKEVGGLKILVLGCGQMGHAIAMDMAQSDEVSEVVAADFDKDRAKQLVAKLNSAKVSGLRVDVKDLQATKKLMGRCDTVVCALPEDLNVFASKAAVEAGVHLVDLSYGERQWEFDAQAKKAGVTIMPDCGVAPGMTNILAGYGASLMDEVDDIRIVCGGIPQKPEPPLGYRIVWSAQGLVNMYCVKSKIVRDGRGVEVETLSGLEEMEFPGLGRLEAFYTDGLSTLLRTMKGKVKNMHEKTARWPGHAEKIRAMRDAGFFATEPIEVGGVKVVPRDLAVSVLDKALRLGDEKDVTVLRVDVSGKKDGSGVEHSFVMIDYFDEERGVTSMARTTGYTAAIIARMVARGEIQERGILPPETGVVKMFKKFVSELQGRGIKIEETSRARHSS